MHAFISSVFKSVSIILIIWHKKTKSANFFRSHWHSFVN